MHVSNFRPVKRVDAAIDVFRLIRQKVRARFVLIGDGPVRAEIEKRVADYGLTGDVVFAGEQYDLVPWLSVADLFLLPSAQESFGLAALEAMACEVPVIASRVGGLPEVIEHGVSGFLHPLEAIDEMAASGVELLTNPVLHHSVAQAACRRVRSEFCVERVVPMYEACYRELLSEGSTVLGPQSSVHGRNFATQIKTASLRLAP